MILILSVSAIFCVTGVFFTGPLCKLFGAGETFCEMAKEYLFWYSVFIILSLLIMKAEQNDSMQIP